ncbi:nuclease [uncultured Cellulomonas sp.]|uniref:nuclease n=1 Tax=uncultured Cellulomonas sp. TaxID=189682 RepID=UPI0028E904B0|nr:nuclease [uncultured Cellulomonas sp.]
MIHRTRNDVLPIQEAVASASPSAWRDGLVASRDQAVVTVVLLDGSALAVTTSATPDPGEPVALHPVAGVLAVGGSWYSARDLVGAADER